MYGEFQCRHTHLGQAVVSAPAGLCISCQRPMQWSIVRGELVVRCRECMDFFVVDSGTQDAGDVRERREAVMPDGRPVRRLSLIAKDRAECISEGSL